MPNQDKTNSLLLPDDVVMMKQMSHKQLADLLLKI